MNYSPEKALMIACARVMVDSRSLGKIQQLASAGLDWEEFVRQCIKHKVLPLVFDNLVEYCPESIPAELKARLEHQYILPNGLRNLELVEQLVRILELLKKNDIMAVPFKGPVLAKRLFGDASLRRYTDLDIFIAGNDAERAVDVLLNNGFVSEDGDLPEGRMRSAYLKKVVHVHLASSDRSVPVDLQWDIASRFANVPISLEDVEDRLEEVSLNGLSVLSLPVEELLCYLCIHGARHRWLYLDSVCCVSELIRTCHEIDWCYVQRFAERVHSKTVFLLGVGLAHELMQVELPDSMIQEIEKTPWVKKLVKDVKEDLFSDYGAGMVVPDTFDPFFWRVKDRFYDKVLYVARVVFIPTKVDLRVFYLPEGLGFLRYFLRPGRLGWEYFRRRMTTHSGAGRK